MQLYWSAVSLSAVDGPFLYSAPAHMGAEEVRTELFIYRAGRSFPSLCYSESQPNSQRKPRKNDFKSRPAIHFTDSNAAKMVRVMPVKVCIASSLWGKPLSATEVIDTGWIFICVW